MKICITSKGPARNSPAEERFGRAPYFMIIDTETGSAEAVENRFAGATGGVGPKAAQLLIARKITALISGMIGGNAREVLVAAGIALYTYNGGGSVDDALEQFRANALERAG